jgi:catechol 2,3-dioxygenase-like lactoylglutathione lyase family enzyme
MQEDPMFQPGGIGRRRALGDFLRIFFSSLGAGAFASRGLPAAEPDPRFGGLDRVEFFVSDLGKSVAFYTRVFGSALYKNNRTEKRYLRLGSTYISMDQGPAPLRVDHFAAGIEDFQMPRLHSFLDQQGIAYKDYPSGRDLYFLDPDGTRVQLGTINSWSNMSNTASPVTDPMAGEAIFKPTGLDHILLNVSEPEKSALFYAKVFGPVTQRNNNRIWFQTGKSRIGLLKTPEGQRPGVNHYCVSAAAFDYAAVTKKLAQAGAKVESPEVASAPEFRDPDGFLIQVMGPK